MTPLNTDAPRPVASSLAALEDYARLPCWDRIDAPWDVPARKVRFTLAQAAAEHEAEALGEPFRMHAGHMLKALCLCLGVETEKLTPEQMSWLDSEVFLDLIYYKLDQYKRPIWRLDETCAQALMDTDPPFDEVSMADLSSRLKLPFPAIILAVPPLFALHDQETGEHTVEAIFLAEDEQLIGTAPGTTAAWMPALGDARPPSEPGITIYAMGRCKGLHRTPSGGYIYNDTHHRLFLNAGTAPDGGPWTDPHFANQPEFRASMGRIVRIVLNFLLALNAGYLEQVKQPGTTKKNPAKITAEARRGVVTRPHTLVRLGGAKYTEAKTRQAVERLRTGQATTSAFVRGHWHCYWMSDAGDGVVLGEKDGKHGKLFKVAKWIFPFQRGAGTPTGPTYKVRS